MSRLCLVISHTRHKKNDCTHPRTPPPPPIASPTFDMLLFCPQCSNTLTVSRSPSTGTNRLECRTCPYEFLLTRKYFERKPMKRKEVDDVMGGEGAWDNVDQTDAQCPNDACEDGMRAYFYMVQIRSADEPMTTFYKVSGNGRRGDGGGRGMMAGLTWKTVRYLWSQVEGELRACSNARGSDGRKQFLSFYRFPSTPPPCASTSHDPQSPKSTSLLHHPLSPLRSTSRFYFHPSSVPSRR